MPDEAEREPFWIGGGDSGIEALLESAGGVSLVARVPVEPAPRPFVILSFSGEARAIAAALQVCRDEGASVIVDVDRAAASVLEPVAVRVLRHLARHDLHPATITVPAARLLPQQVEALRRAAGPDSTLVES